MNRSLVITMFLVIALVAASCSNGNVRVQSEATSDDPEVYEIGETGKIGNLEFTMGEVTERTELGMRSTDEKFELVEIVAKNISNAPTDVSDGSFYMIDDDGYIYESYTYYVSDKLRSFGVDSINPGISMTRHVAFEVPSDATIEAIAVTDDLIATKNSEYVIFKLR